MRHKLYPGLSGVEGANPVHSRFESMVCLGAGAGASTVVASNMHPRDSINGTTVCQMLIVKEEGRSVTQYVRVPSPFSLSDPANSLLQQLGNYIGRGQFGSVYRTFNLSMGQMVVAKRIHFEGLKEVEIKQLMQEVDLVQSLSHLSIVKYEGIVRDEYTLRIVAQVRAPLACIEIMETDSGTTEQYTLPAHQLQLPMIPSLPTHPPTAFKIPATFKCTHPVMPSTPEPVGLATSQSITPAPIAGDKSCCASSPYVSAAHIRTSDLSRTRAAPPPATQTPTCRACGARQPPPRASSGNDPLRHWILSNADTLRATAVSLRSIRAHCGRLRSPCAPPQPPRRTRRLVVPFQGTSRHRPECVCRRTSRLRSRSLRRAHHRRGPRRGRTIARYHSRRSRRKIMHSVCEHLGHTHCLRARARLRSP